MYYVSNFFSSSLKLRKKIKKVFDSLYCVLCQIKVRVLVQLTLTKILKIVATRCRILRLKMHHNRFRLGLRPRPLWGSLQLSPRPPSWIWGPTSKGRGGEGRGEEGRGGKGNMSTPSINSWLRHCPPASQNHFNHCS